MAAASSQMNTRRRTTVHDLAALRLHRDGSRVANSDSNSSSRRAKYAIRDARGNWVAKDAGGLGTVKQRHAVSQPEGEQAEDANDGSEPDADEERMEEEVGEEDALPKVDKGKGRARESGDQEEEEIALNTRAQKRRRFDEDFSYLNPGALPALIPTPNGEDAESHLAEDDPGTFPVPSADLLKCLHYFASTYYSAMGQLYDASREFRKERKIRRAQKLKKTRAGSPSNPQSEGEEADGTPDNSGEEDIRFTEDEEDGEEDDEGKEGEKTMKSRKRRPWASRHVDKDMYKLFDGSALMALGMLLQEHVAELLEPNVPEGWQKEFDLAERDRRAVEKRARRAREMWNQRHAAKSEGSEQPEVQSGGEEREGQQPQELEETVASGSSDGSESGDDE